MPTKRLGRLVPAVAVLFVLAWIALPSPTARASCGDYLSHRAQFAQHALQLVAVDTAAGIQHKLPVHIPRTCQGPSCKASPTVPAPMPAPERLTQDQQAIVIDPADSLNRQRAFLILDSKIPASQCAEGGIFHPPRI